MTEYTDKEYTQKIIRDLEMWQGVISPTTFLREIKKAYPISYMQVAKEEAEQ